MTRHSLWGVVGIVFLPCVVPTVTHAQYPPARQLSITIDVRGGLPRSEGLSFDVFGRPPSIEFVVSVTNDSPDILVIPSAFAGEIGVRVERAQRVIATTTVWESVEVSPPNDRATPVSVSTPFNVAPQGVAKFHGVLRPADSDVLGPGDYSMWLRFRRSVSGVRDAAGKPWPGHFSEEGLVSIRVIEPRTADEVRRSNLAAGNAAMLTGDAALAVKHFAEMVRVDAGDVEAQYGIGQAYLQLRRYRKAAAAFEIVIAALPPVERSAVHVDAAYAYLALGEDARAEATLTAAFGPQAAKRRLAQIRAAVRRR